MEELDTFPQSEVLFDALFEERFEVLLEELLEVLFDARFELLEELFDAPELHPQSSHEQNFVHLSATAFIVFALFFMRKSSLHKNGL